MDRILSLVKTKKWLFIGLFVVLFLFVLRAVLLTKPDTVLTYNVKEENLVDSVQVSGTYTTASQTQVVSTATGIIDKLYIKNNDRVSKGDSLFHIQATATQDQITKAYAAYQTAMGNLMVAQNSEQSAQSALDKVVDDIHLKEAGGDPSKFADIHETQTEKTAREQAQAVVRSAGDAVKVAQAVLTQAQLAYDETQDTTVTAPADGTVVNLLKKEGDQVSAELPAVTAAGNSSGQTSVSTTTPQPVLTIADLSDPHLTTAISEDYIPRIEIGQKAQIVFDALKDKTFDGFVESLDAIGTNIGGIVTYSARIVGSGITANIHPGMSALITIETLRKNNVLDVPNSALVSKDGKNYVEDFKSHKLIEVSIGVKGLTKTEISGGLAPGTVIIANPSL